MYKQWNDKIQLQKNGDTDYTGRALDFARYVGFYTEAAEFPVTSFEKGIKVPNTYGDFSKYGEGSSQVEIPDGYVAASDSAKSIPDFDWRKKKGLEDLFEVGDFLADENLDLLPDKMLFKICLDDYDDYILEAACNLAFRFGMDCTAYDGSIFSEKMPSSGNVILFRSAKSTGIRLIDENERKVLLVEGSKDSLVPFVAEFCSKFPYQGILDKWSDLLQTIGNGLRMETLDGQLAYLKSIVGTDTDAQVFFDTEVHERAKELEEAFPKVGFNSYKDEKLIYEKEYSLPWEVDCLKKTFSEEVLPAVSGCGKIKVTAAVSEDKTIRNELTSYILSYLPKGSEVHVYCSYKQGYSWIDEEVIPDLVALSKKGEKCRKVKIAFKPFLKPGETDWKDEDGATPSYTNVGGNGDPDRWYDLPIRYLQELYPVEDQIVNRLGIEADDVEFIPYEGQDDITYRVSGLSDAGTVLYEKDYLAACDERPYLNDYREMGLVHPATGYIRVFDNNKLIIDKRVKTDVEKIWDIYQDEILPDIRAYVDDHTMGKDLVEAQPFFNKLEIDIDASEPNERLDSREDLISSLDGLHEDIYFVGTDYFKNYGMEKAGKITDAPGLILPKIRKRNGAGAFIRVSAYAQKADSPEMLFNDRIITPSLKDDDLSVWMSAISINDRGEKSANIQVEGVPDDIVATYATLINDGKLSINEKIQDIRYINFDTGENSYHAEIIRHDNRNEADTKIDIRDIDISEKKLIGYDQCNAILHNLAHVKGIRVFETTRSYRGRKQYAVAFVPDRDGYISRVKRITNYPTELITARHHANEVSSTNSAFLLIRKILVEKKYEKLCEHMNLVIMPMENVDGSAIHYELQKDNPTWKFHVARFDALGKEFYYENFKKHTIHTESMGFRRVFFNWLPDIVIDNHGVPSHEWEQQFSGYTSPSYKGFWLPRSLIYGYFFHVTGDEYKSNFELNRVMNDVIADSYLQDKEVTKVNLAWARLFEKYAHKWMPKLFPADYYKNMITYWVPHEYDPTHRYPSIRYPWILSVDYVSEVADETAQGEYLHKCALAHLTHDLAIIDMMMNVKMIFRDSDESSSLGRVEHTRLRPVIADVNGNS